MGAVAEDQSVRWYRLALAFSVLARDLTDYVDSVMGAAYGPAWASTHAPPGPFDPAPTDPLFCLRTIVAKGAAFRGLGAEERRAARRLVDVRNRLFHFADIPPEATAAAIADITLLLSAMGSPLAPYLPNLSGDVANQAFSRLLGQVVGGETVGYSEPEPAVIPRPSMPPGPAHDDSAQEQRDGWDSWKDSEDWAGLDLAAAGSPQPSPAQLRRALTLALHAAMSAPPGTALPSSVRRLLGGRRLPADWAAEMVGGLEADDAFRSLVAAKATEAEVGRAAWLWLSRPEGWEAQVHKLIRDVPAEEWEPKASEDLADGVDEPIGTPLRLRFRPSFSVRPQGWQDEDAVRASLDDPALREWRRFRVAGAALGLVPPVNEQDLRPAAPSRSTCTAAAPSRLAAVLHRLRTRLGA